MKLATNIHPKNKILKVSEASISICNLRLRTYIGFNPEEKSKQQDVVVNVQIRYRADLAFDSDNEDDALNYKTITKSTAPFLVAPLRLLQRISVLNIKSILV